MEDTIKAPFGEILEAALWACQCQIIRAGWLVTKSKIWETPIQDFLLLSEFVFRKLCTTSRNIFYEIDNTPFLTIVVNVSPNVCLNMKWRGCFLIGYLDTFHCYGRFLWAFQLLFLYCLKSTFMRFIFCVNWPQSHSSEFLTSSIGWSVSAWDSSLWITLVMPSIENTKCFAKKNRKWVSRPSQTYYTFLVHS